MITPEAIHRHFHDSYLPFYSRHLTNVKRLNGKGEYQGTCPFHDDHNPSLSFNKDTGVFYCHGCHESGNVFDFYGALHNMDTQRDFPKILKSIASDFGIAAKSEKKKPAKTYDYYDTSGRLRFQVCRYEPKDFRQRQPNGKGGWIWNMKGIEPILYRLPEVKDASLVCVVEGEKDADRLHDMGYTATTSPMGASKWRPAYSESLRGKVVILIPDNDGPGQEHMQAVAASLKGVAAEIKWLDLPALKEHGDFSDWADQFDAPTKAKEALVDLLTQAKVYEPPARKKTLEDVILLSRDFRAMQFSPKETLLSPWLSEQSIVLIAGWRGIGKSWFALSLVDAVSRGADFGPWACHKSVPGLYLDGEMTTNDIQDRLKALNPDEDSRQSHLHLYSDAYANSLGLPRANLLSPEWRENMSRFLMARGVKVWVVDNLASVASGIDENSKQDWDQINEWLLELRFAGISTIMVHHTSKSGGQRGTSAREDNIDASIILDHPANFTPDDGARFIVKFTKNRVSTLGLSLIAPTEFQLRFDEAGQATWKWGTPKGDKKIEVLRRLNDGHNPAAIIESLGITKGRISQIKTEGMHDGLLTPDGKLTPKGVRLVSGAA